MQKTVDTDKLAGAPSCPRPGLDQPAAAETLVTLYQPAPASSPPSPRGSRPGTGAVEDFRGHDVCFCAVGTTRAQAGSAAAFFRVDYHMVEDSAKAARAAGVPHYRRAYRTSAGGGSGLLCDSPRDVSCEGKELRRSEHATARGSPGGGGAAS